MKTFIKRSSIFSLCGFLISCVNESNAIKLNSLNNSEPQLSTINFYVELKFDRDTKSIKSNVYPFINYRVKSVEGNSNESILKSYDICTSAFFSIYVSNKEREPGCTINIWQTNTLESAENTYNEAVEFFKKNSLLYQEIKDVKQEKYIAQVDEIGEEENYKLNYSIEEESDSINYDFHLEDLKDDLCVEMMFLRKRKASGGEETEFKIEYNNFTFVFVDDVIKEDSVVYYIGGEYYDTNLNHLNI